MKPTALIIGIVGLVATAILILEFDPHRIMATAASIGWTGIAALGLYRLLPVTLCALAWRAIMPKESKLTRAAYLNARFVREGVGGILAIVPASGEIVGARVLALQGLRAATAAAATVADVTTELVSQVAFSLLGVAALLASLPDYGGWRAWTASAPLALMAAGLCAVQHPRALALLERLARRVAADPAWAAWLGDDGLRAALVRIYGHRGRLLAGTGLHLVAWLVGVGEAWLALHFMGVPAAPLVLIALEAGVFAVRRAAFAVPWGAGAQEAGYLALGTALGLSPEVALTLSLVRRVPDVVVGVPGLIAWQATERRMISKRGHIVASS